MTKTPPARDVAAPVLELSGVAKQFGAVRALSGVNLRLFAGEVHALMGQNGAGKSTLIKVLTGVYPADQGDIPLNGQTIRATSTLDAQRLGISTVYQEVNLCPNLSVAENIFAGRYPRKNAAGLWAFDWTRMHREARELLARLNLNVDVTQTLASYSVAVQQMVAIARSLSISAQVLILDEPTSSLGDGEVGRLYGGLRLAPDQGIFWSNLAQAHRIVGDLPAPETAERRAVALDPSDLLARRPDIRNAEARLEAAEADVVVARAGPFPPAALAARGGPARPVLPP